jgi:hypothetical protein
MARQVAFERVSGVPKLRGFAAVRTFVSVNGEGLVFYVEDRSSEYVDQKVELEGGVVAPTVHTEEPIHGRLLILSDVVRRIIDVPRLNLAFPELDVFPDGRVLIAAARSAWRAEDDFDYNGMIVDPEMDIFRDVLLLGDGVLDVAVDSSGRVWAAYFDEGIFGNFGWGHPGPDPVGASGLNCFTDYGSLIWSFPVDDEGPMTECYAMNVSEDRVAIYTYYSEFKLCRISPDFETEFFETELQGCRHFAISDSHVLFTGQWNDEIDSGYVGRLENGRVCGVEKIKFSLPGGLKLTEGQFVGRGAKLHFFDEKSWYSLRIDAVA